MRPLQFPSLQHFEQAIGATCRDALRIEGLSPTTIRAWQCAGARLCAYLRAERCEDAFLRSDLEQQVRALLGWIGWLRERGANHTTVNSYWRSLHAVVARVASAAGMADPMLFIEAPRPGRPVPRFLPREALEGVFSFLRNHQWRGGLLERTRNTALIATMALGGCRLGEVLRLTVGDVTLSNDGSGTLLIQRAKGRNGGKYRTVHMPPALRYAMARYLEERRKLVEQEERSDTTGTLFVGLRDHGPITYIAIRRLCALITVRTGIRVAPHMLRHTCATLMRMTAVADRLAMEQLGHSSLMALQRYSHVVNGELSVEVRKVQVDIGEPLDDRRVGAMSTG